MVTLTKFLVIVTFTVVFVLGSAFISGEKQKDVEELGDLDNSFPSEKGSSKEGSVPQEETTSHEPLHHENSDHYWDDVTDSDEDPDILLPHYIEKNTLIKNSTKKSPLLLVSTLDGTLSALDASDQGNILWKIETGPGGLLSSSISKVELNSHGKLVRLIPSLDGGLYKFDGEGIEPIPISADSLLHSSYHAADDLLITGGKEVRTYGVDVRTGHVQYVCSTEGCHVEPAEAGTSSEFLIVRRHSQIVRAIEPRTGTERWNFSVGRHEASLLHTHSDSFSECKSSNIETPEKQMECFVNHSTENEYIEADSSTEILTPYPMEFKVVVPDGVVCAINPERPGQVLWKYKFESPVVHVWKLIEGNLMPLDLFNPNFVPALESQPDMYEDPKAVSSPLLYVGIHNHQLYVQESARIADFTVSGQSKQEIGGNPSTSSSALRPFRIQWQPLSAKTSLVAYQGRPGRFTTSTAASTEDKNEATTEEHVEESSDPKVTAMIVRHQTDYPYERGFYLFKENKSQKKPQKPISADKNPADIEEEEELWEGGRHTPVHIVIVSLWFWWREVVFISLLTAFIFHMVITRQVVNFLQQRWAVELHRHISTIVPPLARLTAPETDVGQENSAPLNTPSIAAGEDCDQPMKSVVVQSMENQIAVASGPPAFVSRYLTDFEPIQCLGRGGFGLVFEVRNRLDDCHYAVKRIQLPNSEEAREKVMREVKALAKLDNPHIVRYFHAWIECPPPGWQEFQDAAWIDSESITGPTPFNTGEDSCLSKMEPSNSDGFTGSNEKSTVDQFPFCNQMSSFDNSFSVRRKSLTNDSFDIVFEDSSRKTKNSCNEIRFEDETSDKCSKSTSACETDGSCAIIRRPSSRHVVKRVQRNVPKTPNYTRSDAKMFLFIQMQLCRKESLREWLRAHVSHRDSYQTIQMFNEIVRAVEYVHLQGLIHRDLKPSNIFFAPDGAIKIGDFGLVTAMAEEASYSPMSPEGNVVCGGGFSPFQRTHTDQVGTQLYMSPEQIEGQPYNHKVDIYSLGLILVELLWPLSTQMEQVTVISQLRKLKFPQGFIEKYPEEAVLLNKMLSRNPDERPTTYGIRASTPLRIYQDSTVEIPEYLHFSLLRPRSTTRTSSGSSS